LFLLFNDKRSNICDDSLPTQKNVGGGGGGCCCCYFLATAASAPIKIHREGVAPLRLLLLQDDYFIAKTKNHTVVGSEIPTLFFPSGHERCNLSS
jgi:hypothetical protein